MAKITRMNRIHRRFSALAGALAVTMLALASAHAQEASSAPALSVVTSDNVLVRSGAADSYYPFGRLNSGAVVEVLGEKFNWARIALRGPSFKAGIEPGMFFGHIVYPQQETARFRVNADGKTGITLGRMDVLAPNLTTNFNPSDSWKPLIRLEPNTTVRILSTTNSSNNTVHLIALPSGAEGWVSKAHLREATAEEIAAWKRSQAPSRESSEPERRKPETPREEETTQPAPPESAPEAAEEQAPESPEVKEAPEAAEPPVTVQQPLAREEAPSAAESTSAESATASPVEPAAREEQPEVPLIEELDAATIDDLEVLLVKLREAQAEISEISSLRHIYLEFAVRNAQEKSLARFANARAEQLEIWRQVRERQAELKRIRERSRLTGERTEMALLSIHAHADYDAIGRLTASTIFDGQRLPKMLRLQEPGTNRTLAYIEPEGHGFDMIEMLGLWLGVVGEKSYDPALRLNIITPKRIDLLAPAQ